MSEASNWCSTLLQSAEAHVHPEAHTQRIEPKRWRGTPPIPPEKLERAWEMHKAGKSRNNICKTLKISRVTLWRKLGPVSYWNRRKQK